MRRLLVPFLVSGILHVVPWWRLVLAPGWPSGAVVAATVVAVLLAVGLPAALLLGRSRGIEGVATAGAVWLGVVWQLFVWTLAGELVRLGPAVGRSGRPAPGAGGRARGGRLDGRDPGLGGLPGARPGARPGAGCPRRGARWRAGRAAHRADHRHPSRPVPSRRWAARITGQVNALDADVLAHTGDLVDGSLGARRHQVEPLGAATARDARVFITGNHEYYSGAREWTDYMCSLGWTVLRNRHVVVRRGATRWWSPGSTTGPRRGRACPGTAPTWTPRSPERPAAAPVVLLAHQPRQVLGAVGRVDLQLSGHTHGGQLWPFGYLVRLDQPTLAGLSRHGARTQLYTSRGTGFWGPPFRIFAPPEITVLTLRPA